MAELKFDFRDLFKAPRLGFSLDMMWTGFKTIILSYAIYCVFSYLALIVTPAVIADGFVKILRTYEFFPCVPIVQPPWYGWVIFVVGVILSLAVFLLGATQIAKMAYQRLKEDFFYGVSDSIDFVKKRWLSILIAPVVIFLIALAGVITLLVIGLLGLIPYVGELGFSLAAIFIFFGSLLLVYLIFVFAHFFNRVFIDGDFIWESRIIPNPPFLQWDSSIQS